MTDITFGTDGWRAIIADQFTFRNLDTVSRATVRWIHRHHGREGRAIVGYDTRFMGDQFAEYVARVLASQDIEVILADSFAPTPAISWATKAFGCQVGVVITASHNPPQYSGYKLKTALGGPATPDMVAEVEGEIPGLGGDSVAAPSFARLARQGRIERRNIISGYLDYLRSRLDVEAIRRSGVRIAHDAMYGSGQGIISKLLSPDAVVEIRCDWNPGFYGQAPEPIERNLEPLRTGIIEHGCDVGIANDGDADRVGMFDERGTYVDSHTILSLLVKYLHKDRGLSGKVVKTFSTTSLIDRMADAYGLEVDVTPIGFKHIAAKIIEEDVLVGGEESGGIAVKGHIPERDGLFIGLLITEMLVKRGKKLSELVAELHEEFGPHVCRRIDLHTTEARKQNVLRHLREEGGLRSVGGSEVQKLETLDGFKHLLKDGWLMVRASGTEPVLRIYSEAPTGNRAQELIEDAAEQLGVTEPAE